MPFTASNTAPWTMARARVWAFGESRATRVASTATTFHSSTVSAAIRVRVSRVSTYALDPSHARSCFRIPFSLLGAIGPDVGAASPRRLEQGFIPNSQALVEPTGMLIQPSHESAVARRSFLLKCYATGTNR